jgi:hypothetical protein
MRGFCNQAKGVDENANGSQGQRGIRMEETIRVLSVGSVDRGSMVHDALLEGPGFWLSIATDYWGLLATGEQEDFELAILHNTLDSAELEDACRWIRHQWPHARILVVRAGENFLEDYLYDDRVISTVAQDVLFMTIEQLAARLHAGRSADERL